jgi:hypothetical protein
VSVAVTRVRPFKVQNSVLSPPCSPSFSASPFRILSYLPKDHDELESVSVVSDRDGDIELFTPAELTEMLCCAGERMIPFLVLGAFAGSRRSVGESSCG